MHLRLSIATIQPDYLHKLISVQPLAASLPAGRRAAPLCRYCFTRADLSVFRTRCGSTDVIPTDAIPTRLFGKYQVLYAREEYLTRKVTIKTGPITPTLFTCVSYAEARNSYRLDVRLSVCPSHVGTLSKRLNILSSFLHHTIAHSF